MKLLVGPVAATLTPFKKTGGVDFRRIPKFVRFMLDRGIAGLWVGGTTGEVPTLEVAERKRLHETFAKEVAGEVPVVAHVGHPSTAAAAEMARQAAADGVDAIACCPPWPPHPMPDALLGHWQAVAGATDLPFFIYVIPWVAPIDFTAEQINTYRRKLRAAGMKFSIPDVQTLSRVRRLSGKGFNIVSGIDEVLVPCAIACCDGSVGLGHNCIPEIFVAMHGACERGDIGEAQALQGAWNDFTAQLPENMTIFARAKVAMKLRGVDLGDPRLPMLPARGEKRRAVEKAWRRLMDTPVVTKYVKQERCNESRVPVDYFRGRDAGGSGQGPRRDRRCRL